MPDGAVWDRQANRALHRETAVVVVLQSVLVLHGADPAQVFRAPNVRANMRRMSWISTFTFGIRKVGRTRVAWRCSRACEYDQDSPGYSGPARCPGGAGVSLGAALSADYFLDNADYTLRWPPEVFAKEVRLLVRRGSQFDTDDDWEEEVDLLLRQAFVSSVPAEDFGRLPFHRYEPSTSDDEPF